MNLCHYFDLCNSLGEVVVYRARNKGMQIVLSNSQAEQLSKSRKKFLATAYKPLFRALYLLSNLV